MIGLFHLQQIRRSLKTGSGSGRPKPNFSPEHVDYMISKTDPDFWRTVFPTKTNLTKLIIDCGQRTELQTVRGIDLSTVERLTRNMCFAA